jgi:hypothetical protein
MGNWASYVLRRRSDGPLVQATASNPGTHGWMCWILDFLSPDELAELAGVGPALLVSEADSGMAVVIGQHGGQSCWRWVYNERAFYGEGYHGDGPAPDVFELEASRPARARTTAADIQAWAGPAGLADPDEEALVNTLMADNVFAMESVHDLFVTIGVWEPV